MNKRGVKRLGLDGLGMLGLDGLDGLGMNSFGLAILD